MNNYTNGRMWDEYDKVINERDALQERLETLEKDRDAFIQEIKEVLTEAQAKQQRFQEALDLIGDIAINYDGYRGEIALQGLVNELAGIARKATDTDEPIWEKQPPEEEK